MALSNNVRSWFKRNKDTAPGCVGISMCDAGISLSYGVIKQGEYQVSLIDFAPLPPSEYESYAKGWIQRNKLKNAKGHFVLNDDEYQLELIEKPQVQEEEMREAVKWKIKDLVQYPSQETILDVFNLPDDAYRGRSDMLYAVVSSKEKISSKLEFMRQIGLVPSVIDIPELVLRNILLYFPDSEEGTTAILKLNENDSEVIIYSHEELCFARNIDIGFSQFLKIEEEITLDNSDVFDRLVLDLQRSLDYFESQVGKGTVSKIIILPVDNIQENFIQNLSQGIGINVEEFNMKNVRPIQEKINSSHTFHSITSIGSVLRRNQ
ncbi:MAG: pilus assembly protein PilM [Bermanella sp.]